MQNKNTNKIIIPVVILVAVLIVAGVAYFLLKGDSDDKSSDDKSSKEASSMVADEADKEDKTDKTERKEKTSQNEDIVKNNSTNECEKVVEDYMDAFLEEDVDEMATVASDLLKYIYQEYYPYADEQSFSEFWEEEFINNDLDYFSEYFNNEFYNEDYDVSYEIVEIKDISEDELEELEDGVVDVASDEDLEKIMDDLSDAKVATVNIIAQSDDNEESLEYRIILDKSSGSWKVFITG